MWWNEEKESSVAWFLLLTLFTGGAFPIIYIIMRLSYMLCGGIGWKNHR